MNKRLKHRIFRRKLTIALKWTQGLMTLGWVGLIYPTVTMWRDSVPWIGFMSVYAIVISHFTSWIAALAAEEGAS